VSWPSTDREADIEKELQALRRLAVLARVVVDNIEDAEDEGDAVGLLRAALEALPEEST